MPTYSANDAVYLRLVKGLEGRLDRWLGEGGRTFVRLAIAALLPLLIFGILAGSLAAERTTRTNTRGLAVQLATRSAERISLELNAQIDLSEALGASTALDRGDFDAFRTEVERLTALHPLWKGIEVTNAAGKPLFSTSGPAEARLGKASDQNSFREVLKTNRPSVGGLLSIIAWRSSAVTIISALTSWRNPDDRSIARGAVRAAPKSLKVVATEQLVARVGDQ